MSKNTKLLIILGIVLIVGYVAYKQIKKSSVTGKDDENREQNMITNSGEVEQIKLPPRLPR